MTEHEQQTPPARLSDKSQTVMHLEALARKLRAEVNGLEYRAERLRQNIDDGPCTRGMLRDAADQTVTGLMWTIANATLGTFMREIDQDVQRIPGITQRDW